MSKQLGDYTGLYLGNWLYNAGGSGWLRVLSNIENRSDDFDLKEDCSVAIRRGLLEKAFQDKKIFFRIRKQKKFHCDTTGI